MNERKIDFEYLIQSWQDESPDSRYYFDTETGCVELVQSELYDLDDLTDEIEKNHERYLYIPKANRDEGRKDLKAFMETVTDSGIIRLLEIAMEAPDSVHACRSILSKYPEELTRWDSFRVSRIRERIDEWLAANFITAE
jgi:hypothetical protein